MICSIVILDFVALLSVMVRGGFSEPTAASPKSILAGESCNPWEAVWE
jgi:hypothetical protein